MASTEKEKECITLITRDPFAAKNASAYISRRLRRFLSKFLYRLTKKSRFVRPAVGDRLAKGLSHALRKLGVDVKVNPPHSEVTGIVAVLSSQRALRTALELKNKKGGITALLAGPAIVESPVEGGRLIAHPAIDRVIVSDGWVGQWWGAFDQYIERKIEVWTPGVEDEGIKRSPTGICLVYAKNADEKLFHSIMESLWSHNLVIMVSHFGTFREAEYSDLLKKTKFVLYLTDIDTDGHPLRQAWMADIPTLVLSPKSFTYQGKSYEVPGASSPGFSSECGLAFSGEADFEAALENFLRRYDSYTPRQYALSRFTHEQSAKRFLEIVRLAKQAQS